MRWRLFSPVTLAVALLAPVSAPAWADLTVVCVSGCLAPDESERTPNLILRETSAEAVTLEWRSPSRPHDDDHVVRLYAGNPALQDAVQDRGILTFEREGTAWAARKEFPGTDLERGSFLTVLTLAERAGEGEPGLEGAEAPERTRRRDKSIVDWRAWRLLTLAERQRELAGPERATEWELDLVPALVQVTSGRGELPRTTGGGETVWLSLARRDSQFTDIDIDGEHSGVPGLSVHVSPPWPAGAGDPDWKQQILDTLTGVEGHTIRFGSMTWVERPDRELDLGPEGETLLIRHYYSAITLFTTASSADFDKSQVDGGMFGPRRYFSHETSARLRITRDPRFWASYSRHEYGADPHLLALLADQVRRGSRVPGLGAVQTEDGDGGPPVYRVGMLARIEPWMPTERAMRAGFIESSIVAARAGYGAAVSKGSSGRTPVEDALCKIVRCDDLETAIDLDDPPRGFRVSPASASLETKTGNLPFSRGEPRTAQRDSSLRNFPDSARFAVAAHLRSGALMHKRGMRSVEQIAPINAYAQFVIKLSVAMFPDTPLITNEEAILLDPSEGDLQIVIPKARGLLAWLAEHKFLTTIIGLIVLLVLVVALVPGAGRAIGAGLGGAARGVGGIFKAAFRRRTDSN